MTPIATIATIIASGRQKRAFVCQNNIASGQQEASLCLSGKPKGNTFREGSVCQMFRDLRFYEAG
eukprot:295858-Pelagomonas_calceolata.AAC.1